MKSADLPNRPVDVLAAVLSTILGLSMGLALFSQLSVFLLPLIAVGLYVGIRVLGATRGLPRGFAWVGIVLNSGIVCLWVYAAVRYVSE